MSPKVPLNSDSKPNYPELVRFLVEPFLDSPKELRVDCEPYADNHRVWIRLAFAGSDKGRVFGRGGRTIQAIRTVVVAAGQLAGQSVHLEIHGSRDFDQQASHGSKQSRPRSHKRTLPKRR